MTVPHQDIGDSWSCQDIGHESGALAWAAASRWGVLGPWRDREPDTGIDGFIGSHRRSLAVEGFTTKTTRSVTDVLMQIRHRSSET